MFDWGNRKIVINKAVEETKRLDSWYGPIHFTAATKRASASGIKTQGPVASSGSGRIEVVHSVGNPLCTSAAPITYNYVIEASRTSIRLIGRLNKVPNHEGVWFPKGGNTGSASFRRTNMGFICLNLGTFCGSSERINTAIK